MAEKLKMRVAIHFCYYLLLLHSHSLLRSRLNGNSLQFIQQSSILNRVPLLIYQKGFLFLPPSFRREEAKRKQNKNSRSPSELFNTPNTTTSHLRMTLGSFVVRSMCLQRQEKESVNISSEHSRQGCKICF